MTATIAQIHGMMLEEALLYLLEVSGYRRVEGANARGKHDLEKWDTNPVFKKLGLK